MEGLQIPSFNAVEDFETVAANVRVKIDTYFSQLLEIIRNRQTNLISELDEILSRYRQGRARLRDKVRELEEIKKYHEDRYSSSTVKHLQDEILNRINSELAELREEASSMSVEFEWSQDYARDASKIGKLKCALFYSQSQFDTKSVPTSTSLPTSIQPGSSSTNNTSSLTGNNPFNDTRDISHSANTHSPNQQSQPKYRDNLFIRRLQCLQVI